MGGFVAVDSTDSTSIEWVRLLVEDPEVCPSTVDLHDGFRTFRVSVWREFPPEILNLESAEWCFKSNNVNGAGSKTSPESLRGGDNSGTESGRMAEVAIPWLDSGMSLIHLHSQEFSCAQLS